MYKSCYEIPVVIKSCVSTKVNANRSEDLPGILYNDTQNSLYDDLAEDFDNEIPDNTEQNGKRDVQCNTSDGLYNEVLVDQYDEIPGPIYDQPLGDDLSYARLSDTRSFQAAENLRKADSICSIGDRSKTPLQQSVMPPLLLRNITNDHMINTYVCTLSALNGKLLVGYFDHSQLFIYNHEGRHLSTVNISTSDKLYDATWTPRGFIIYTTQRRFTDTAFTPNKVVVMSGSGEVKNIHTQMIEPRHVSISNDNIVYLTDWQTGLYQSTDDGISWIHVLNSTDGFHFFQAIKVVNNHSNDFWMSEGSENDARLRVFRVEKTHSDLKVTWRDINATLENGERIDWSFIRLAYDGNAKIYLGDSANNAVHVMLVNGQYHRQLLSPQDITKIVSKVSVDKELQLLYVGQLSSVVEVFKLTNSDGV